MICHTREATQATQRAVKLTRKNKLGTNISELKGSNTSLTVKKYFYNHLIRDNNWEIISIAADKKAWLHHYTKKSMVVDKNLFYDQVAARLLSQIKITSDNSHIQLIIDKSKTRRALQNFDNGITSIIRSLIPEKRKLSIYHRRSDTDPGLQAADLFSWGVYRKYQKNELEWYEIFKNKIALEMEFKF